ncbi:hypothetical protein GCM10011492_32090 [Flexivirga endophytica]|uniref:Uncharacterized protein n=1 Tax=Flexivirga endophytica TaxID=1849103 RepID=A0A916TDV4_9MICO|nr:hypothetical protein [Flexivirga endophytica]GGB38887.1 hypothetical protein GCM10011492_32090 [Flexivirga endophytica]GHB46874.1 hypothetical protein GCM10008112_14480 [Flexivirga endophytica]
MPTSGSTSTDTELLARYAVPELLELGAGAAVRATGSGVRSYLADGRGVAWHVPDTLSGRAAIDAELSAQRVTGSLARRAGSTDPAVVWPRWIQCEVTAKLLGLPVLSWLGWPGLIVPGDLARQVRVAFVPVRDVLVCCGLRAQH